MHSLLFQLVLLRILEILYSVADDGYSSDFYGLLLRRNQRMWTTSCHALPIVVWLQCLCLPICDNVCFDVLGITYLQSFEGGMNPKMLKMFDSSQQCAVSFFHLPHSHPIYQVRLARWPKISCIPTVIFFIPKFSTAYGRRLLQ